MIDVALADDAAGACGVFRDALANHVQEAEVGAARRVASVARLLEESGGARLVFRNALAFCIQDAEVGAARRVATVARLP